MQYFANPSTALIRAAMTGQLGMIATPGQRNEVPAASSWCADNGCFAAGYPGDSAWLSWLTSFTAEQRSRCAFAVAPDVVGDAAATLIRSAPWLPVIRALGFPAAFVAQDGLEDLVVPWDRFDAFFIGGSTAFKIGPAARALAGEALERGKYLHLGRVNSAHRMRYASWLGCHSVDGTHLTYAPDRRLPEVLRWLRAASDYEARVRSA